MKRSSFLKSLLGIAVAPLVVAAVDPVSKPKQIVSPLGDFYKIKRSDIADMIWPNVRVWETSNTSGKGTFRDPYIISDMVVPTLHGMTYVEKVVHGVHYAVPVRANHLVSYADDKTIAKCLQVDAELIINNPYTPNQYCDKIIIL